MVEVGLLMKRYFVRNVYLGSALHWVIGANLQEEKDDCKPIIQALEDEIDRLRRELAAEKDREMQVPADLLYQFEWAQVEDLCGVGFLDSQKVWHDDSGSHLGFNFCRSLNARSRGLLLYPELCSCHLVYGVPFQRCSDFFQTLMFSESFLRDVVRDVLHFSSLNDDQKSIISLSRPIILSE